MIYRVVLHCFFIIAVGLLSACGGGGGGSNSANVSGVAAAGAPISGIVYLKDSSNPPIERSAPIGADGSFMVNSIGLTPPYLMKAVGTVNGADAIFYSFATSTGTANVNPLTQLAVVLANGSDDLASLYSDPGPARMRAIEGGIAGAIADIRRVFQPTLSRFGADSADFFSAPFAANHQGLDLFLDMCEISTQGGYVRITDRTTNSTSQATFGDFRNRSVDIFVNPVTALGETTVWPATPVVNPGGTVAFTAVVIGNPHEQFVWRIEEADGGTITSDGVYTAPAMAGIYRVRATSVTDPVRTATAMVTVASDRGYLRLVAAGEGVFNVEGVLAEVEGIDLELHYRGVANPQVQYGPLAAGTMKVANTTVPGTIRIVSVSAGPISGSGTFATIKFEQPTPENAGVVTLVKATLARLADAVTSRTSQVDEAMLSQPAPAPPSASTLDR